jgi:RHS repeat-associated protein
VRADQTVASGMVKARFRYDPYGNVTLKNGSSDTPWRFAGAWFDRFPSADPNIQHGLYKMGERYYDPRNGRWTQLDPLHHAADLRQSNRYAYVGGDPVNETDPTGLWFGDDAIDWAGAQLDAVGISGEEFAGLSIDSALGGVACAVGAAATVGTAGGFAPVAAYVCGATAFATVAGGVYDATDENDEWWLEESLSN